MLASLPKYLWSQGPTDVGFCRECALIRFDVSAQEPIWQNQYPQKLAVAEGIAHTIQGLLHSGLLETSESAWNTPILPVKKHGTDKYRMAHDLRRMNEATTTKTLPVPNPFTALSNLHRSRHGSHV